MSETTFKRSLIGSTVVHAVLLLALIVYPLVRRLIHPRKPPEMITFVDLQALPPPPAPIPEPPKPQPEPPKPQPEPEPPKPALVPEKPPEKPKPESRKIKVSTNKIVRSVTPQPPKPQTAPQPTLTKEQLRKLLEANIKFSPAGTPSSNFTDMSLYYATVYDAMYGAWRQPSTAALGLAAQVTIRVQRNGAVTARRLIKSSGSSSMDDSVMQAVNSVGRLRPLPAEIRDTFLDITVEFVVGQ